MSGSTTIPSEFAPVIQAYAKAIQPAFPFILISAVSSAMLVPLFILLLMFSTRHSRRQPIFILNAVNISLGIIVAVLSNHLTIGSILFPLNGVSASEDFVYNVLYIWLPWITEAVLIFRVIVVYGDRSHFRLAQLLAFPIAIKIARAVINIIFLVVWKRMTSSGKGINQFSTTEALTVWMVPAQFVLELVDNLYISFLFLYRLHSEGHIFSPSKAGSTTVTIDSNIQASRGSKIRTLFWIATTNLIFPLIFELATIIVYFTSSNVLLVGSINMADIYISIISTAFATIWASTKSFRDIHTGAQYAFEAPLYVGTSDPAGMSFRVFQSGSGTSIASSPSGWARRGESEQAASRLEVTPS